MKKRFTDEQIISILREAESKEIATVDLCKRHNITDQTFTAGETSLAVWMSRMPGGSESLNPRTTSSNAWWRSSCW